MANAKNTIQNIPLTGELCLNTLKTDVKAFEGYNEKNSTVFGGELAPVWKKETELGDKDDTFTIFNSKGEPFTIENTNNYQNWLLDKNGQQIEQIKVPYIIEGTAPDNAYWYALLLSDGAFEIYITSNGDLYGRFSHKPGTSIPYTLLHSFNTSLSGALSIKALFTKYITYDRGHLIFSFIKDYTDEKYKFYYYSLYDFITNESPIEIDLTKSISGSIELNKSNFTSSSFISIARNEDYDKIIVQAVPFSGKREVVSNATVKSVTINCVQNQAPTIETNDRYYFFGSIYTITNAEINDAWGFNTFYISPQSNAVINNYTCKTVEVFPQGSFLVYQGNTLTDNTVMLFGQEKYFIGHDGNFFIPGIKTYLYNFRPSEYYIDGTLYAYAVNGRLVRLPGVINTPFYNINPWDDSITFKDSDGKWYTYAINYQDKKYRKKSTMVLDNRYVPVTNGLFDIETKKTIDVRLDYIDSLLPCKKIPESDTTLINTAQTVTGMVYAAGYNAEYTKSGSPFTSTLMNPKVITGLPIDFDGFYPTGHNYPTMGANGATLYYSIGDNVQSAEYQGNNTEYFGTTYPIDVNGNIIYPITWDSQIINGYTNNDLVKTKDTAYPLIYWNNNQKLYSYYLLSSLEDIKGVFALQSQRYVFDDNNIYTATFTNGVVESMNAITYIKNMQFLGTLPTSAVFYSKFNKTFYQFTGDAILSKMFEASDIDEIKMVGQNPSSLSLWICTDKGVYILSDTDMFKLDYDVSDIYFNDEKTIIITEGETNWIENDISLYDIGNEATETPIKLQTKFYGLGGELKANYDCWYIRLHNKDRKSGKLKVKVNTITNSSFETEEKTFTIEPNQYDSNNTVFIRYQPKYQSAVATQLELESDIAIYQLSLGVNSTDAVAQQSKFNF